MSHQINPAVPLARTAPADCQLLHEAALQILEGTGVRLFYQPAVDLLQRAGATVTDGNRVTISSRLVEWALTCVPKEITLYDRLGEACMTLNGRNTYYGPGSDCLYVLDHRTGERRRPTLEDVATGIKLCDALPNIDFVMSMFVPPDLPAMTADRHQMEVMLNTTTKPIVFVTSDLAGCVDSLAMAEIAVGGETAFRQRPMAACYVNVTNALRHNQEALEKVLFLSGKGVPFCYIPVSLGGAAAPITPAGGAALWHAGDMVGLVLSQLTKEGSPFISSGWSVSALDMRRATSPYVEPEKQFIAQELAHYLNLPMFAMAGCSDSKQLDAQAGVEAALTLLTNTLAGSHIVHDLGYLEAGMTGSLSLLAICDEIIDWIRRSLTPVEITPETLALDVIEAVGPDGSFLEQEHTLQHYRERWMPQLMDRDIYDVWLKHGGQDLAQRAGLRVDAILETHSPEPLDETIKRRLREYVQEADSRYNS